MTSTLTRAELLAKFTNPNSPEAIASQVRLDRAREACNSVQAKTRLSSLNEALFIYGTKVTVQRRDGAIIAIQDNEIMLSFPTVKEMAKELGFRLWMRIVTR